MIGPKFKDRFILRRTDVLAGFSLNSEQLVWAYVASGSDDLGPGFRNIGFKTAIGACEKSSRIDTAFEKFKKISNQDKEKLIGALTKFLDQLEMAPSFLVDFPTRDTVPAHDFIFAKKEDGSRVRLLKLVLDANSPYGIGIAEDVAIEYQNSSKKPTINTGIREQERIDSSKAKHSIRFEFELTAGIENPVYKGKAEQVSSKQSVSATKVVKPSLKKTQRKRNEDKKEIDVLKSLHMPCSRFVGTVEKFCCSPEFNAWFQKDTESFKVDLN
jgi:hypothetical protein